MKKLVIAGPGEQARNWIMEDLNRRHAKGETTLSLSEYTIVHRPDTLRGLRNPDGIFIGTWNERKDLREILMTLLTLMSDDKKVQIIRQLCKEHA
jgi:hypothetical protein